MPAEGACGRPRGRGLACPIASGSDGFTLEIIEEENLVANAAIGELAG
jgi:hypothetical protein